MHLDVFIRSIYPDVQVVKLTATNQQLYGLVGLRRKLPPGQYFMQTPIHHGTRMSSGAASPQFRQTRTTSPPMAMDSSHVARAPTPPIRTEGLVTKIATRPQSPSVQDQRHDAMVPNTRPSLQPNNFQAPIRPQANLTAVPRPSSLTASEFLGSLVDSRLPNGGTRAPAPLSIVPTSTSIVTPSSVAQKTSMSGLVPVSQVVTSVTKSEGLPTARKSETVSSMEGTANGGSSILIKPSDKCDVSQSNKSAQNVENSVAITSQKLPSNDTKKGVVVNGTAEESSKMIVVNTSQAKVPVVNGG